MAVPNKQNDEFNNLVDFVEENNAKNKVPPKKRKKIIIILANILTIALLVGGGFGIKTLMDQKQDIKDIKTLQQSVLNNSFEVDYEGIFNEDIENKKLLEYRESFKSLVNQNSDTVGWLKIKNTRIDLPIVQGKTNNYYLNKDFNKKYNSMGWVFADYRNHFDTLDQNTIIYGHTYKDTIMLSSLQYVLRDSWLNNKDNYIIEFNTLKYPHKWEIFSIYTIKETNDYLRTRFVADDFNKFIDKIKKRSIKDFNVEVNENDKILTISTCYIDTNHRLVVHAKLMDDSNA